MKVKGDNYKKKEGGGYTFEISCDLFAQTGRGNNYKPMDKWWLVDHEDMVKKIKDPSIEKVSANRLRYLFDIED